MGLEKELKKRNRRANLRKIILGTVAIGGIVGIGLVAPNVLVAMKKLGLFPHRRQRENIIRSRDTLIKQGFIENKNNKLKITQKGKVYLARHTFYKSNRDEKRKWDGKWRVLIFDVPEKLRYVRDEMRITLIAIGFMRLQDSVWVYPYDCEDLITLLKADLEIGKDVLYMIVEALENDEPVKDYFGLNKK